MISADSKLDILAEALRLIFFEKHWSKMHSATKAGTECSPWDLDADAWNAFGAVERVLSNKEQFRHLVEVVGELELDAGGSLPAFDLAHSHEEVLSLFYQTLQRLGNIAGYNMWHPWFPPNMTEEQFTEYDSVVLFFSKEFDEEFERTNKEQKEKMEADRQHDADDAWYFLSIRDDE